MAAEAVDRETGEVADDFPEVKIDRKWVIAQQGRDYILSDGLIDGLHALSGGYFEVESRLEQLPTETNGMLAVCSARVTVFAPGDRDRVLRVATGIGDASPSSVNRMITPHLIRMSETRAVSRALRTLLNVGAVAFEELGPSEAPPAAEPRGASARVPSESHGFAFDARTGDVQGITIEGKLYNRAQVEEGWRLRRAKTEALGIAIPPELAGLTAGAPLRDLAGATQTLRRLCEATQAGQR